jgi:hypothetical protein
MQRLLDFGSLVKLFGNRKKGRKARKGKKFFVVLLMPSDAGERVMKDSTHS